MSYRKISDVGTTKKIGITKDGSKIEVPELFTKQDKDAMIKDNSIAVIDIYADWCSPCLMSTPLFAGLSHKYQDLVAFAKEQVELRLSESVQVIPTFQVYNEGKLVKIITGPDMEAIEAEIQKHLFKEDKKTVRPVRRRRTTKKEEEPKKEEAKKEETLKKEEEPKPKQ